MNESDLERALRDWAKADADVSEPARLRARVMAVPEVTEAHTRRRPSWLEGWLRTRPFAALGMAAAVVVLFAAVLVPGVLRDPDEEGTLGDPATSVVVAQDGSGDFGTIMDAVGAAADGDTILVRPGTYLESILIDKDITLRGDGDREDVVIRAPSDQADRWLPEEVRTYAIRLQDTDAHVENLTLTGPASALIAHGGSPRITDVAVIDVGVANRGDDMDPSRFAGLTLVAGTDNGASATYHRELALYQQAGIAPTEVLQIATIVAARVMKEEKDYGSIAPGKVADVAIVNGRPATNVAELSRVETVIRGGRIYKVADLREAVTGRRTPTP